MKKYYWRLRNKVVGLIRINYKKLEITIIMKIIVIFLIALILLFLSKFEIKVIKLAEIYRIKLYIIFFNFIKIKVYNKSKKQKLKVEELIEKIDFKKLKNYKVYKKLIKKIKFNIKKLNLQIEVGSKNLLRTVFLNTIIANNISVFLGVIRDKIKDKNLYYKVTPKFNKEKISLKLDCIIQIKIVNIIYIIYLLLKERRKQNGLTSNRKHNVVCND